MDYGKLTLSRVFQLRNRKCRICNNLDPQGRPESTLNEWGWRLGLIDISLYRVYKSGTRRRRQCQFCRLLTMSLVALVPEATCDDYADFRLGVLLIQTGDPILIMLSTPSIETHPEGRWLEMYTPPGKNHRSRTWLSIKHGFLLTLCCFNQESDHHGRHSALLPRFHIMQILKGHSVSLRTF